MGNQPSFQFYHDDYIGGTMGFTLEQHGAYLLCVILQFKNGHFSEDDANNLTGGKFGIVKKKFKTDDLGFFYSEKMDAVSLNERVYRKSRGINSDKICSTCQNKPEKKSPYNEYIICLSCENHMKFICKSYDNHMGGGGISILNTEECKNNTMPEQRNKKVFDETEKSFDYATRFDKALKREITTYKNRTTAQLQEWAAEFDRINRIDGHSWEDIAKMIRGVLSDDFWRKNILSPAKLRKQWADGNLNRCFEGRKDGSGTQHAKQTIEARREAVRVLVRDAMPEATDEEIEATIEEYLRDNKN